MAVSRPSADLKRACVAALLAQLARGGMDAVADPVGRHAPKDVVAGLGDLVSAIDVAVTFLRRGDLPLDSSSELFIAVRVFALRLADALELRLGAEWQLSARERQ